MDPLFQLTWTPTWALSKRRNHVHCNAYEWQVKEVLSSAVKCCCFLFCCKCDNYLYRCFSEYGERWNWLVHVSHVDDLVWIVCLFREKKSGEEIWCSCQKVDTFPWVLSLKEYFWNMYHWIRLRIWISCKKLPLKNVHTVFHIPMLPVKKYLSCSIIQHKEYHGTQLWNTISVSYYTTSCLTYNTLQQLNISSHRLPSFAR